MILNNKKIIGYIFVIPLLIALLAFNYYQYLTNRTFAIQIENNYQLAFNDLTTHLNNIEEDLTKAKASYSKENLAVMMSSINRNTYAAQKSIGQLPLILTPLEETEKLLYNIARFSEVSLVKLVDQVEINLNYHLMDEYSRIIGKLNNNLQQVNNEILVNNESWLQLQNKLITSAGLPITNSIADGLEQADGLVAQYPEQEDFFSDSPEKPQWYVRGTEITREEAQVVFQQILNSQLEDVVVVNQEIADTRGELPGYMISLTSNKGTIIGQVAKRAGKLNWMIWEKPISATKKVDVYTAGNIAENFITDTNSQVDVKEISRNVSENFYEFTFACMNNNVLCYPDTFWIRVAKDDGKVVGYNAVSYLNNHKERDLTKINVNEQEALQKVNPLLKDLKVLELAVINNKGQEVLVYEISGSIGQEDYLIFINAETGKEELVIRNND